MSIFGNEDAIEIEPTRVVKNSLGIDLGTLNTVIAKPSGDKFDLYQIPSVVAVKKDDPSAVLAVGEEAKKMLEAQKKSGKLLTIGYQHKFDPDVVYAKKEP